MRLGSIAILTGLALLGAPAYAGPRARTAELADLFEKHDYAGAVKQAERLLLERPADEAVLTDMLIAYVSMPQAADDQVRTARRSKVISIAHRLWGINPSNKFARQVVLSLEGGVMRPRSQRDEESETLFREGLDHYTRHNWADALSRFSEVVARNPRDWEAFMLRGHTHLLAGSDGKAEVDLARAASLAENDYLAWLYLGDARRKLGKLEAALRCYTHAYVLNPNADMTYTRLLRMGEEMRFKISPLPIFKAIEVVREGDEVIMRVRKAGMSEDEKELWVAYSAALAERMAAAKTVGATPLDEEVYAYDVMLKRYHDLRVNGADRREDMETLKAISAAGMLKTYVALYADWSHPERRKWVEVSLDKLDTFVEQFLIVR